MSILRVTGKPAHIAGNVVSNKFAFGNYRPRRRKEKNKMPCDYKQYPENWKWLSRQIISDAGNRCELCYAPNGEEIYRDKGCTYPWAIAEELDCVQFHKHKIIRVVLTVHHIDSDKSNNTKQNLIALCQRCHLRLDLQKHMKNRREKNITKGETCCSLFS
jgi:5-methylcytosine-specific restriction endonuclease McrA